MAKLKPTPKVMFPGQAKQKSLKEAIKNVTQTLEELHNNVIKKSVR